MSSAVMPSNKRHVMSTNKLLRLGLTALGRLERLETIPVVGRTRADPSRERASQRLRRAEPRGSGDLVDAERGGFEETPRDLDAHLFDVRGRRAPDLGPEHAREMSRA